MDATNKASALIEALPYLQSFRGQTFLIKMGGSAMENPELVKKVMRDIVFLEVSGINPVVVHGGGKAISSAMRDAGLDAQFIGGFRVTTPEAMDIVEQTLSETLNPSLVEMIKDAGGKAIGVAGSNVFIGNRIQGIDEQGGSHDIGRVGEVVDTDLEAIQKAVHDEIVPVISPVATEQGSNKRLNVNADLAAASLAKSLKAAKLIDALESGVGKVHFIDGRTPHSLLLEIFTKSGVGTEIKK